MNFAVIGFGPVGQRIVSSLLKKGAAVRLYDVAQISAEHVDQVRSIEEAVRGADTIIVAVPSKAAEAVASKAALEMSKHSIYLDWSSASPAMKIKISELMPADSYIDVTLLDPISAERPLLAVSGMRSDQVEKDLSDLGFEVWNVGSIPGASASIKTLRSLFMKPLEALCIWWFAISADMPAQSAALRSIDMSLAAQDFSSFAKVMLSTNRQHAARRGLELREASKMLDEAQIGPLLQASWAAFDGLIEIWAKSESLDLSAEPLDFAREVARQMKGNL